MAHAAQRVETQLHRVKSSRANESSGGGSPTGAPPMAVVARLPSPHDLCPSSSAHRNQRWPCTPRTRCSSRRPGIACNRDNDEMLAPRQPPQRASTRRQPPRATLHDDCPLRTSERLSKGGAMPSGSLHQLDDVRGPQGVARRQPHARQLHLLVLIIDTSAISSEPPTAWLRRSRRRSGP